MNRVRIRPGDQVIRTGVLSVVERVEGNVVHGYQVRAAAATAADRIPFQCPADYWLWFAAAGRGRKPVSPRPPEDRA